MFMCTDSDCSNTEYLNYDDTEPMTDPNSPTDFRRTKENYLWASKYNSFIRMTTKIGNDQLRHKQRSIQVILQIVNDEYVIGVGNCTVQQKNYNSACGIDDLYIRFGDQGFDDQFPSIRISYGGKFFYYQSLC